VFIYESAITIPPGAYDTTAPAERLIRRLDKAREVADAIKIDRGQPEWPPPMEPDSQYTNRTPYWRIFAFKALIAESHS
jgi:hypothetical protein